jgi:hypothetical protein
MPSLIPDPAAMSAWGLEFWLSLGDFPLSAQVVTGGSIRDPLYGSAGLPGSAGLSVQFYTLMAQGFSACPSGYVFAASPCLYFQY